MTDYPIVLLLALLPTLGNFVGGVVAELVETSPRMLSRALHVAAGVVSAVVAVELMPTALSGGASIWAIVLALLAGGGFYMLLVMSVDRLVGGDRADASMVYAAVGVDLFADGLMIGVGSVVSFSLALILAVGQSLADFPEGFAAIANLRSNGVRRFWRLTLAGSFIVFCLLGATIGYWLLRGQSEALKLSALAFTAGILQIAAVEDLMKEAHEAAEDTRWSSIFFIGGFALFTALTGYFDH
ncbi:ZIP family metal transporter [Methylocystis sp.]|uniref:ZIP family metal transporter n=1 Tax=Methylocystis sp. TaxID=1911079 RepID=UPI003DA62093